MSKTVILKAGLVLYGENNALIKSLLVDNESRSELINKNASQKKKMGERKWIELATGWNSATAGWPTPDDL